jgi:histone acetyltransferase (RNA polymerase elongator complex component)
LRNCSGNNRNDRPNVKGYGKVLLTHVENCAKEKKYEIVSLSSGLQRAAAHQFYEEKMDYGKTSYIFLKKL